MLNLFKCKITFPHSNFNALERYSTSKIINYQKTKPFCGLYQVKWVHEIVKNISNIPEDPATFSTDISADSRHTTCSRVKYDVTPELEFRMTWKNLGKLNHDRAERTEVHNTSSSLIMMFFRCSNK